MTVDTPVASASSSTTSTRSTAAAEIDQQGEKQTKQRVVAFGASTFKKALRGWSNVPAKRLCYRLQQRVPVVLVDEFRTSQISNVTLERQQNVYYRKPVQDASGSPTGETKITLCWASLKQYQVQDNSDNEG